MTFVKLLYKPAEPSTRSSPTQMHTYTMENPQLTPITKDGRQDATLRVESVTQRFEQVWVKGYGGIGSGNVTKHSGWDITFRDANNVRVSYRGNADWVWEDSYGPRDERGYRQCLGAVCILKPGDVVAIKGTFERTGMVDIHVTRPVPSKGK